MLIFIGKLTVAFFAVIISIRILGKSALAQLTPHDFTAIIFLVYLAFGSLQVESVSQAIVGIILITILHITVSKLSLLRWMNRLVIGEPTILIRHGNPIPNNLRKTNYSLVELLAYIRTKGYPDIQNIEYAILEPTGDISILPKKEIVPVTPKHLNIDVVYEGLPLSVIIEGQIQHKNLKLINKDKNWLLSQLKQKGHENIRDIFFATVKDTEDSLTVYKTN